ncbi:MAG: asparagine synthase-related protein, partial [Spirochaetota bacterium]
GRLEPRAPCVCGPTPAARLAAEHVKVILTGEGADELFAGYTYYKDIDEIEQYLHNELRRSVETLHNINLQRVDRLTMAHSIEGRVPFLDLEMIKLAQRIPAEYKLFGYSLPSPEPTEKWILRKAFEDMLPEEIVWRRKEQFDEGSGTAGIMPRLAEQAVSDGEYRRHTARNSQLKLRSKEEAYYHRLFDRVYSNAQAVLETVGRWTERPDHI